MEEYLRPTKYADMTSEVWALTARLTEGLSDDRTKAVAVFYFIRGSSSVARRSIPPLKW